MSKQTDWEPISDYWRKKSIWNRGRLERLYLKWKVSAFTHIYTKDCYPSNNENNEWFPHSKDSGLWRVCGCSTQ